MTVSKLFTETKTKGPKYACLAQGNNPTEINKTDYANMSSKIWPHINIPITRENTNHQSALNTIVATVSLYMRNVCDTWYMKLASGI